MKKGIRFMSWLNINYSVIKNRLTFVFILVE